MASLVFRRERELGRLVLELSLPELDLGLLLREQVRLLVEPLVRLLQLLLVVLETFLGGLERLRLVLEALVGLGELALAAPELLREVERLLEEILRAHRRGDRVHDDAEGLRQLV